MKKVLLASTALVGAAAVMAAPAAAEVGVSVFTQFHVSAIDQDAGVPAGTSDLDFTTNTEVNFHGSQELDNGISFGFQIQLEADTGRGNHTHAETGVTTAVGGSTWIDENDIWVSGSFGKVVFGSQDGPADSLMVSGSFVGIQLGGIGNPTFTGVTSVLNTAPTAADVGDSGDAIKISYFTPRFSGFQGGISYSPDLDSGGDGSNAQTWNGGPGLGLEDFVEVGLNFSETFNGIGVDAGLVGVFADSPAGADREGFGGGLMLSFSGFSVAAGYAQTDDDGAGGTDNEVFDVGVGYGTGPWSVTAGAAFGEDNTTGNEWELYGASVVYVVGPGLSVYATVSGGTAETGGVDNDFIVGTSGIKTSF